MVAQALARWPSEAAVLPYRVEDLVAEARGRTRYGVEGAALALELASVTPTAGGIGWAFAALKRWEAAGRPVEDLRALVAGRRLVVEASKPKPAGRDVPEYRRAPAGPVDPESERMTAELLRRGAWWKDFGRAGKREPAPGSVAKPPPKPAGAAVISIGNPTPNTSAGQGKSHGKDAAAGRSGGPEPSGLG